MRAALAPTHLKLAAAALMLALAALAAVGNIARPAGAATTPVITGVNGYCTLSGGETLNITGVGLSNPSYVTISGISTSFTGLSDTAMNVICPVLAFPDAYPLSVTVSAGIATFPYIPYTSPDGPTVTGVSPSAGPVGGGTVVTITGTNLTAANAVYFGQTLASCQAAVSPYTSITCTSPAAAASGTVDVWMHADKGPSGYSAADHFTYTSGPSLASISPSSAPASGAPLTQVVITGTNLSGATSVQFGATTVGAADLQATSTTITLYAPSNPPGVVNVTVTTPQGSFTLPGAFRFVGTDAPTIVNVTPSQGPAGTTVTITGTGFAALTGVTFGAAASTSIHLASDTSLTAVVPANAPVGPVDVTVTTSNGPVTDADGFTVVAAAKPTVSSVSPSSGSPGTSVTILGSGFTGATSVTFGGVTAAFMVNSDTSISATAPVGIATGDVNVVVTSPAGSSTVTSASVFTNTSGPIVAIVLRGRFTLIGWIGADGISPGDALRGGANGPANGPANGTNDITSQVASIWSYDAASGAWRGYFPGVNIPGASDLTALKFGAGYFIALKDPTAGPIPWLVARGGSSAG